MPGIELDDQLGIAYASYDWAISGVNCMAYLTSRETLVRRLLKNFPIIGVGYQINQTKTPVYGYADVGPRTIARGTRTVAGQFVVYWDGVTSLQDELMSIYRDLYNTSEQLDLDEELRLKYWNTRYWEPWMKDPQRKNLSSDYQNNLFYAHPNFDISIVYGTGDEAGIKAGTPGTTVDLSEVTKKYSQYSGPVPTRQFPDVATRFLPPKADLERMTGRKRAERETIVGCQIMQKMGGPSVDAPVLETYNFIAYDVIPK